MNCNYRKAHIVGNWKMNKTPIESAEFVKELKEIMPRARNYEVGLCMPSVNITNARRAARDIRINIGAENCNANPFGAYTGEISADMLASAGCKYVIVGHSERRAIGETDDDINAKAKAVLNAGMIPVICVGETLRQRQNDATLDVVAMQVKMALANIPAEKVSGLIIAYEPIWAIGTGETATPEQAQRVCNHIRKVIRDKYKPDGGATIARRVPIIYGGSMNEQNAESFLSNPDIDGGLIGTASLNVTRFNEILRITSRLNIKPEPKKKKKKTAT